jgi:hypothetical protein
VNSASRWRGEGRIDGARGLGGVARDSDTYTEYVAD